MLVTKTRRLVSLLDCLLVHHEKANSKFPTIVFFQGQNVQPKAKNLGEGGVTLMD